MVKKRNLNEVLICATVGGPGGLDAVAGTHLRALVALLKALEMWLSPVMGMNPAAVERLASLEADLMAVGRRLAWLELVLNVAFFLFSPVGSNSRRSVVTQTTMYFGKLMPKLVGDFFYTPCNVAQLIPCQNAEARARRRGTRTRRTRTATCSSSCSSRKSAEVDGFST